MSCSACEKAKKAREAKMQARGKSTGSWSVTYSEGPEMGQRFFFDNKLAAMAFAAANPGNGAMIRQVA